MGLGGLGAMEIALIMLVLMLVFGARRLPELGRGLGKGIREFKDSVGGISAEIAAAERSAMAAPSPAPRLEAAAREAVAVAPTPAVEGRPTVE